MEPRTIQALLNHPGPICLSLFMPMFRVGRDAQQNPIRFKNLMKVAETLLDADPIATSHQKKAILRQLETFQTDDAHAAWRHPATSLALFATPETCEVHALDRPTEEQVHVGERFYLRPILPSLHGNGRFVLVAVSQKHVRLFEGSGEGLEERTLDDLPQNLKDALNIDDYLESIQHYGFSTVNKDYGMFHGQGEGNDGHKADILQFFHRLDPPLNNYLEGRTDPLVFAGVEYLYPIFKEATTYPHLLPDCVHGNFDHATPHQLHAEAWKVVEPHFHQTTAKALALYEDAFGQNRAITDLETILKAAEMGAVENLFIRQGAACWGYLDSDGHVQVEETPDESSLDLIDEAAVVTLKQGGDVFVLEDQQFPTEDSPVAARLRFELAAVAE